MKEQSASLLERVLFWWEIYPLTWHKCPFAGKKCSFAGKKNPFAWKSVYLKWLPTLPRNLNLIFVFFKYKVMLNSTLCCTSRVCLGYVGIDTSKLNYLIVYAYLYFDQIRYPQLCFTCCDHRFGRWSLQWDTHEPS